MPRRHAPPAAPQRVQAGVGGDLVQPGPEPGAALEAPAPPPGAQEGLLDQVLGLLERAEHPVAVDVQLAAVAPDQLGERRLVPGPGGLDDRILDTAGGGRAVGHGRLSGFGPGREPAA
jgi:hypothetical protein